jgi:predicted nucleic acid-binding protein
VRTCETILSLRRGTGQVDVTAGRVLPSLDDLAIGTGRQLKAAFVYNDLAGSAIDFLICAVAQRRDWHIFTTDHDFERYGRVLGLKLYAVR